MALPLAVQRAGVPAGPACSCPPDRCNFRVAAVYWFLLVWDWAERIYHEPFVDVLRDYGRASRDNDTWIQGGKVTEDAAAAIYLSLLRARDEGGLALRPHNAEAVARFCCPHRHHEGADRLTLPESEA